MKNEKNKAAKSTKSTKTNKTDKTIKASKNKKVTSIDKASKAKLKAKAQAKEEKNVERAAFAKRLAAVREAAGLTQYDLAEKLGVSRSTISMIEQGKQGVALDMTPRIAKACKTTAAELIADKKVKAKKAAA